MCWTKSKKQHVFNGLSGDDYRATTLAKSYQTILGPIIWNWWDNFNMPKYTIGSV